MTTAGIGYDVHPLVPGRPCILGGVRIPSELGPDGHSDADVLIHAIADALLGAAGAGDIGAHFPNTDPRWKDASSVVFLEHIRGLLADRGARIHNIDATLIAQAPRVLPHVPAMKTTLAAALGIDPARVNIKATTNERLGFIGREEGIAALATASVEIPD
jgi:2-C-methyl-D-erythritol 2,4-cyclodiphosphate synthase